MTGFTKPAVGAVLCALGIMLSATGADALYKKSWAEECKEQPKDKREGCCTKKQIDCFIACDEQFSPGFPKPKSPEQKQCIELCKSAGRKCQKGVKEARFPNYSTPTRPQTGKLNEQRVCCKTGTRYGWASLRACRGRRGRAVNARRCRRPAAATRSRSARLCCRLGRSHKWASARECRARRGKSVPSRYCARARR